MRSSFGIPVLYYHSVGNHLLKRPWSFLSTPLECFIDLSSYLLMESYITIFLKEVFNHVRERESLASKSVALTFDDGFLDNWVNVLPLAKAHGFKFTIFVNPEFVEPSNIIRPTMEAVRAGKLNFSELNWWGYLSWAEMREMEKSGLVDIQSHALTHTWYFSGPRIVDFHHPGDSYFWLYWNEYPQQKYAWLSDYREDAIPYGRPVYEHGKALTVRRYFEDEKLKLKLIDYVRTQGGPDFFKRDDWRKRLYQICDEHRARHTLHDSIESEIEYEKRIRRELQLSKHLIEQNLNKEVDFLCWPGGGYTRAAQTIAQEVGYLATTGGTKLNLPGTEPLMFSRLSGWFSWPLPSSIKLLAFKSQVTRGTGRSTFGSTLLDSLALARRIWRDAVDC